MILRLLSLAQADTQSFQTTEFDLPESTLTILLVLLGLTLLFTLTVRTSLRDSRFLSGGWRFGLLSLRVAAILLLLLVLLNPRQRTQTTEIRQSRVAFLVDTSASMDFPASEKDDGEDEAGSGADTTPESDVPSRSEAVQKALIESGLLDQLSETHSVSVYGFDSSLKGPQAVVTDRQTSFVIEQNQDGDSAPSQNGSSSSISSGDSVTRVDLSDGKQSAEEAEFWWKQILQPKGQETRLGESLHQLIGQISGRTLSGIAILTDGRDNAGLDVAIARQRAENSDTRLFTIGVGSTRSKVNLWLAGMQSPTDVHRGDPFDISVVVQGSGLAEQGGTIHLFQQSADGDGKDRKHVADETFRFRTADAPEEVAFQQQISVPGKYEYIAVAELADGDVVELTTEDNQRRREVEVTDRKQKVLIISSGPMRDYRFVRNMLFRHSGISSDVWLQTVTDDNLGMVSQEAEKVLISFPKTEAELFEYDVIVAFDADWSLLSNDQQKYLNRWVDEHSGGVIFIAGELFTPQLAKDPDSNRDVAVLYPVVPNRMLSELRITQRADQPWPVGLTPEGRTSRFLEIADATGRSDVDLWKQFKGIFRSYPVKSVRDGAVVLATYDNPRARTQLGQSPFLATQFYGKGRTMFVSSAETWRLRAISPEGHQRFWTGMIRDVGQGRRVRGRSRGLLLVDHTEATPGQTVTIRAQLFNARMQPLQRESVQISIIDAQGRPVNVPSQLRSDSRRPGQFLNTFRPPRKGTWRVTLPVPESSDVLQETIEVTLPNLEAKDSSQNIELLTGLTRDTGGQYMKLADVAKQLPGLLPDCSEPVIVDEKLQTLWDRDWLMYLIIGLLAVEWVMRRIVRLS